jgi:hypothetical protein
VFGPKPSSSRGINSSLLRPLIDLESLHSSHLPFLEGTQDKMEFQDAQKFVLHSINEINHTFQKVPGSAMLIRYIQSSYQDDPVRSAIELILVIFFVRYLLAPSYATHNGNFVTLSEEVGTSTDSVARSGDADVKRIGD